jgi:hypothetical protein
MLLSRAVAPVRKGEVACANTGRDTIEAASENASAVPVGGTARAPARSIRCDMSPLLIRFPFDE